LLFLANGGRVSVGGEGTERSWIRGGASSRRYLDKICRLCSVHTQVIDVVFVVFRYIW
jgi:hypothetical protein